MKLRIRFADQVVGLFTMLALVMVLALAIFLGINQRLFETEYHYRTLFNSAGGLAVGAPITLRGFEIGKVKQVSFNEDDRIEMVFQVYQQYVDRVRKYSVLELVTSPIGIGGGLVFHMGLSEDLIDPDGMVTNYDSEEAQELIAQNLVDIPPRDDSITRLLGNVNRLIESINRTVNHLNLAIENRGGGQLGDIVGSVNSTMAQVPETVRQVNELLATSQREITAITGSLDGIMGEVGLTLGTTNASLPQLMAELESVLANVGAITANLDATTAALQDPTGLVPKLLASDGSINTFFNDSNRLFNQVDTMLTTINRTLQDVQRTTAGIQSEVPKISALILETRGAIQQANQVMEGVKNNPLLRGGISERPIQESKSDSLRTPEF